MDDIGYKSRQEIIDEMKLMLADNIVDVELNREHYDLAITRALRVYRQKSGGATEESVIFIQTQADVNDYQLPDEVMEVRRLYRRGIGTNSGGGTNFDPFDVAFNNMYMLQAGQIGGVALFDAFAQYKEIIQRVFGGEYDFIWRRDSKILTILRNIRHEEDVAVAVHNYKPESVLLKDVYSGPWLAKYALAEAKRMLGEARSKYTTGLPGPGGAIQLNGDALKAEAEAERELLIQEIRDMEEGSVPLGFTIG